MLWVGNVWVPVPMIRRLPVENAMVNSDFPQLRQGLANPAVSTEEHISESQSVPWVDFERSSFGPGVFMESVQLCIVLDRSIC